jgi:hypothetical protein
VDDGIRGRVHVCVLLPRKPLKAQRNWFSFYFMAAKVSRNKVLSLSLNFMY